jgi:outer membrane protein TolC
MQLLYPAEQARVLSQVNLLNTYVSIYKALGGGWNLQPDDPNPTWFSPAGPAAATTP